MALKSMLKNGASTFAHFAGLARPAAKKDEEESKPGAAAAAEEEECDEEAQASGAAAEDGQDGKKKSKKSKKAGAKDSGDDSGDDDDDEEEEDDEDRENDDDEDETENTDDAKTKGGKASKAVKAARRAGIKAGTDRCRKIFESPAAAHNVRFACKLAFNTSMSASAAIALLEETPAPRGNLSQRMDKAAIAPTPAGGSADLSSAASIANSWDVATAPYVKKS